MDKKKTIKEMREEIQRMIEASQRRQKGEKVTSQDIKENPIGSRAKGRPENFRTDVDMGIKAQKSKDYSKAKTSGTYMDSNNKPNPPKAKKDDKPRQRPGAGREAMMAKMEEERKRRQRGESSVVGS